MILDGVNEREEQFDRRNAENATDRFGGHFVTGKGVGLVEVGEAVTHRTIGLFGEDVECFVGGVDSFLFADVAKAAADLFYGQSLEVESLHAAENGLRHLVDFGGRKDEDDVLRRFFERFQERVEGAVREHVDFVDNENLVLADDGRILHALDHVADVVDASIGCSVYFEHVHRVAASDVLAAFALSTGVERIAAGAVERAGEDTGTGSLTDTAGSGE